MSNKTATVTVNRLYWWWWWLWTIISMSGDWDTHKTRRSIQRAQTSLAEADHYPHIVQYCHCQYALMNVGPWWWKASGSLPASESGYAKTIIWVVFLFIYSSQKTQIAAKIESVLHCTTLDPSIKCNYNPFITFWVMSLTNKQTNKHHQKHKLLCGGGKIWEKSLLKVTAQGQ